MKTIISVSILLSTILCANELAWVDEQIQAIKPARKSLHITKLSDPFVFLEKNGFVKKEIKQDLDSKKSTLYSSKKTTINGIKINNKKTFYRSFTLDTIINSSAMINGTWYKKGANVYGYRLVSVEKTSVVLKKDNKRVTLSTNTKQKTVKFKNK